MIKCNISLALQVGKSKKSKEPREKPEEGVGMNVKSIIIVALIMMLMLFAVHCTWVTSNAYSSPSIVLASYGHDGYVIIISYYILVSEPVCRTLHVGHV